MSKEQEIIQTIIQGMMDAKPKDLLKMMQGSKVDMEATLEDIPLLISLRFNDGEILARVKIREDTEKDGDQPETN